MRKPNTGRARAFRRERKLTDAEIVARAERDPDNPPLTKAQLAEFRRVSFARRVRYRLGMSQTAFAEAFGIPLSTLRDWELHRAEPDQTARSYLEVIAADPVTIRKIRELEPA